MPPSELVHEGVEGNGLVMDYLSTTDPAAIQLCVNAFEQAWELSIPNSEYQSS